MPLSILLHYSTAIVQSLQFIWTKQFPSHTLFNTVLFPACSSDSLSHQTPTASYDSDLLPVFLISSSWQWSPKRTLFCSSAPRASSQALSHIFLCIMACWSIYHTLGILCVAQLFLLLVVWLLGKEADLKKKIQIASFFFEQHTAQVFHYVEKSGPDLLIFDIRCFQPHCNRCTKSSK